MGAVDIIAISAFVILGILAVVAFVFISEDNKKNNNIVITNENVNNSTAPKGTSSGSTGTSITEYNFLRKQIKSIGTRLNTVTNTLDGHATSGIAVSSLSVLSGSLDLSSIPFGFSSTNGAYSIKMGTDAEPYFSIYVGNNTTPSIALSTTNTAVSFGDLFVGSHPVIPAESTITMMNITEGSSLSISTNGIWTLHFEIYEAPTTATIEGLLGFQMYNSLTTMSFLYQNTNSGIVHRESTIMNIQTPTNLTINSISSVAFPSNIKLTQFRV